MIHLDPGDCIICGAAHCSCGGPGLAVVQLPNRDAAVASAAAPLVADVVQATLPAGSFTTATYRGTKKKRNA